MADPERSRVTNEIFSYLSRIHLKGEQKRDHDTLKQMAVELLCSHPGGISVSLGGIPVWSVLYKESPRVDNYPGPQLVEIVIAAQHGDYNIDCFVVTNGSVLNHSRIEALPEQRKSAIHLLREIGEKLNEQSFRQQVV